MVRGVDPQLAWAQRQLPPADRHTLRRGQSSGGPAREPRPLTLARGMDTELTRDVGTTNDGGIRRDRMPYYAAPRLIPPGQNWVDWSGAGPTRPELHMRQTSWRREVGSSRSRYPVIADSPTGGLHTMTPGVAQRAYERYGQTDQMRAAPYNRLCHSQYSGQTYSQITVVRGLST